MGRQADFKVFIHATIKMRAPTCKPAMCAVMVSSLLHVSASFGATDVTFSSLTLVGERWDNGQWSRVDLDGHPVGPPLKRGDPGATLISSPRQSPDCVALSPTAVVCTANSTAMASTDGGRQWARVAGGVVPPSIPASALSEAYLTPSCPNSFLVTTFNGSSTHGMVPLSFCRQNSPYSYRCGNMWLLGAYCRTDGGWGGGGG